MNNLNNAAPQLVIKRTSIWHMYCAVVGIGIFCALVIVTVFELTLPIIKQNRIELREKAIFEVLADAKMIAVYQWNEDEGFEILKTEDAQSDIVFAGYDSNGRLVGFAIETQAMGYADIIRLVYGYSPQKQAVVGIRVLESRETPGLGDRIETDGKFLNNFVNLDVRLTESGGQLIHQVEFVKPGGKNAAWQIDGISGATISSRATATMIQESTNQWLPRLKAHREDFVQ